MADKLGFVTYESPYAPCGGIAAVMARLPEKVQAASGRPTVAITPFHNRSPRTAGLDLDLVGVIGVPSEGRTVLVNVRRLEGSCPWYFLQPEDPRLFAGRDHPYDSGRDLLRDSLFFGAAAARALHLIGPGARWALWLQDWEAATCALALARGGSVRDHDVRIVLHNSYDSPGLGPYELRQVGIEPHHCPGPAGPLSGTVLERSLSSTAGGVPTVSRQFALDLLEDPIQATVLAPHLQQLLRGRLVGVDNGPFGALEVDPAILAEEGRSRGLVAAWKAASRDQASAALKALVASDDRPVWGDPRRFAKKAEKGLPWLLMAGRDDPRQKGYDVAAEAARRILEGGRGEAQFLFFPIPGDEGRDGLRFLADLAAAHPDRVLVLPFVFREGYLTALRGAAYGLMPSLYEPFGMANEFYLNGTVGLARATGGLVEQIVPRRDGASYTPAVAKRAERWHRGDSPPTGILFRERDDLPGAAEAWRALAVGSGSRDRVAARRGNPVFEGMVAGLEVAIREAIALGGDDYHCLLAAGIEHIRTVFFWERASAEYLADMGLSVA